MAAQEAASQINWKNYPRLTIKFRFENLNSSLMTAYRTSSINTDDLANDHHARSISLAELNRNLTDEK